MTPLGIAVDKANVYFADDTGGTVMSVPIGGNGANNGGNDAGDDGRNNAADDGGLPTTLASGQERPYALAVDATNVYWVNNVAAGSVMKVPIGGGTPTTLASGQMDPFGLAIDSTAAYWTTADGMIGSVPLAGGTPTTVASAQDNPQGIAVDSTSLYWTNFGADTISKHTPK